MAHVRELPSLRLTIDLETPSGRHYMWSDQDPNPENVPSGLRFSDVVPGGFEQCDVTLPRKSNVAYSDLERLSTLHIYGAGGEKAGEYRLEWAPRVSGSQFSVAPGCVGWQAHLEDDRSAQEIYVGREFSRWSEVSIGRRTALHTISRRIEAAASVSQDVTTGQPALRTSVQGVWTAGGDPICEAMFDSPVAIGSLYFAWKRSATINNADANWAWGTVLSTNDDAGGSPDGTGNLRAAGPGTGTLTATTNDRRFAFVQFFYTTGAGGDTTFDIDWTVLAVYGDHGLTKRGTASATDAQGLYGSDVVAHAVGKFAPLLNLTVGGTVLPSAFVIPHLEFLEPTTAGEIVRQATRFGLEDWAVWDNKTFYWAPRGTFGRKWRARISPSQLEETGQSAERLYESVVVQYQDVGGSTRTVGPPGSGSYVEDASLKDDDSENPANKLGITKRSLLQMGVSTSAGAIEVGRRFLEEQKLLDTSGRAQLVGHVTDDRGVVHPYWKVRAGDTISFVDSNSPGERRIVRTDKDHSTRTCSVDLDAPPEGLQALLERLGVALVGLGL